MIIDDPSGSEPLIFSITAAKVTSLLTSNHGAKWFELDDLPSTAKRIIGRATLYHSLCDGVEMIWLCKHVHAGVCYYGYDNVYDDYIYISVYSSSVPNYLLGQEFEFDFLISEYLEDEVTYYSFIKNEYPAGYVYGTLDLHYSTSN